MTDDSTDEWTTMRENAFAPDRAPEWPPNVRAITLSGLGLLGLDERNREIYWDGAKVITQKRLADFERALAVLGLVFGGMGAASALAVAIVEIGRTFWGWK